MSDNTMKMIKAEENRCFSEEPSFVCHLLKKCSNHRLTDESEGRSEYSDSKQLQSREVASNRPTKNSKLIFRCYELMEEWDTWESRKHLDSNRCELRSTSKTVLFERNSTANDS